jgi:hypothetical protein
MRGCRFCEVINIRYLLIGLSLSLVMTACSGLLPQDLPLTSPGPLINAKAPLLTPTYDGSGQTVEPTVLFFPNGWEGHQYWMAVSPYPYSKHEYAFENPSILVSEDGTNWGVPSGLKNPIALPPPYSSLSDGTVVYDTASNQLWVYFLRDTQTTGQYQESLLRTTSPDGIRWSTPQVLISGENTFLNSPSVTEVGNTLILWTVDTGSGCTTQTSIVNQRVSSDGISWSPPRPLNIKQPGYVIWHLNIILVPAKQEFMALVTAYPNGTNCGKTKLFFANSHDGINWQCYSQVLLGPSATGWDDNQIYRSSLIYDPVGQLLRVWYSAFGGDPLQWHVGYTEESFPVP